MDKLIQLTSLEAVIVSLTIQSCERLGEYLEVAQVRQMALDDMYDRHPERFKGRPTVQMPATEVCINPVPEGGADQATVEKGVNFPTLQRVIAKVS